MTFATKNLIAAYILLYAGLGVVLHHIGIKGWEELVTSLCFGCAIAGFLTYARLRGVAK